jgi:hypothetical protein
MVVLVVAVVDMREHAEPQVHPVKEMMVVFLLLQVMVEAVEREQKEEMEILPLRMEHHVGLVESEF